MPRIRTAYVIALWSAITAGAVVHVVAELEVPRPTAQASAAMPVTLASAGHREDALGNRYRTRAGW